MAKRRKTTKKRARPVKRLARKPAKRKQKKTPARVRPRKSLPRKPTKRKAPARRLPAKPLAPTPGEYSAVSSGSSLLDWILFQLKIATTPEVPIPSERWTPPAGVDEEYGFNLRETGVLDPSRFYGRDEVTMSVVITRFPGGRPERVERVVTFDPGEDEMEFWYNYHEALRDILKEDGSDVSISVAAMAA